MAAVSLVIRESLGKHRVEISHGGARWFCRDCSIVWKPWDWPENRGECPYELIGRFTWKDR